MTSNENDGKRRKRRLASTVKDRTVVLLGLVTLAGVSLVCVGGIIQGSAYVPALLLELGASMMLLVPLAVLGFMLEGRLGRAEEQIRATAARLETLTAVTRQQLAESRQQRENMFHEARRAPDEERIHALLGEALQTGAIAASGVRVQLPKSPLRLSFRPDEGRVEVRVEEPDGTVLERVTWDSGEPVTKFTHRLAGSLKALRRYPGDASFDPTGVLKRLLEVIHTGIKARTGELAQDLGHIIEIPNEQWAISVEGLFSLQRYYHIPAERISGSHEDWPRHMRTYVWVNPSEFEEAYLLARQLLSRPSAAEAPGNGLPHAITALEQQITETCACSRVLHQADDISPQGEYVRLHFRDARRPSEMLPIRARPQCAARLAAMFQTETVYKLAKTSSRTSGVSGSRPASAAWARKWSLTSHERDAAADAASKMRAAVSAEAGSCW